MRLRFRSPSEASVDKEPFSFKAFMTRQLLRTFPFSVPILCLAISAAAGMAQDNAAGAGGAAQPAATDTPNAPVPQTAAAEERAPQTKRILGIIPNFRSVSTDEKLPPQTVKEKLLDATEDSFDYSSIVIPAVLAGSSLASNSDPEFGHGGIGYWRYFWRAA